MKRQVAILGPTPEFLRWSVRRECALRHDTVVSSIDETEKRLRPIRAVGVALKEDRVLEGIAVWRDEASGDLKAFRLDEVLGLCGGLSQVTASCSTCPANISEVANSDLAGCFGWLKRDPAKNSFMNRLQAVCRQPAFEQDVRSEFLNTDPAWYGLWSHGSIEGKGLRLVNQLFKSVQQAETLVADDVLAFSRALERCIEFELVLDVELVPPGFSDGIRWTIQPHCDRCKAVFDKDRRQCPVCKKPGLGHPEIHRKVLGLRPFVDIRVIMTGKQLENFVYRLQEKNALS